MISSILEHTLESFAGPAADCVRIPVSSTPAERLRHTGVCLSKSLNVSKEPGLELLDCYPVQDPELLASRYSSLGRQRDRPRNIIQLRLEVVAILSIVVDKNHDSRI